MAIMDYLVATAQDNIHARSTRYCVFVCAFNAAGAYATREPHSLCGRNDKRPDGATQIPWKRGRCQYQDICASVDFIPVDIKTDLEFITELANRLKLVTGDKLEPTYLFQRLSIAIQRGNELCFNGTFVPRWYS